MNAPAWRGARWIALALAPLLSGCHTFSYLTQAAAGQAELLDRQQPIAEVLRERRYSVRTRRLLAEVAEVKAFGEAHGLKRTRNYEHYVQLPRSAAVWVVSACDELAFEPHRWRFPITGSITYLGWFDEQAAHRSAAPLRARGLDVDVRPASAYSTLGFFRDPVLSSMLREDDESARYGGDPAFGELANVILHESLHATFFVAGQSTLNESVASFVGDGLADTYLRERRGEGHTELLAYRRAEARAELRGQILRRGYQALAALYASPLDDDTKRTRKAALLRQLERAIEARRPLNNATLVQYDTYGSGHAEMAQLWQRCDRSWSRLLRALDAKRRDFQRAEPHAEPAELLAPLLRQSCPG